MDSNSLCELVLESLENVPVVTNAFEFYKRTCMVCMNSQGHYSGVQMRVFNKCSNNIYKICWSDEVTEQLRKSHADLVEATQFAACAIAFLLVQELTELTVIEQAARGTTVDYYLAPKGQRDEVLIFNHTARLEISGILEEKEGNTIELRVQKKIDRLKPEKDLPTLVSVTEFSQPRSKLVEVS